jgi:hypothetical protein
MHLVYDFALMESLRCLSGGLWCLRLRGHQRNKIGHLVVHGGIGPCVEVSGVKFNREGQWKSVGMWADLEVFVVIFPKYLIDYQLV